MRKSLFLSFRSWLGFDRNQLPSVRRIFLPGIAIVIAAATLPVFAQKSTRAEQKAFHGPEQMECTSYPEYQCYPSGRPAQPESRAQADAKVAEEHAAALETPNCTSYPEYSCSTDEFSLSAEKRNETKSELVNPDAIAWYAVHNDFCSAYPEWSCDTNLLTTEGLSLIPPVLYLKPVSPGAAVAAGGR